MKPSIIAKELPTLIAEKIPAYITGQPGGGKTSVAHVVAKNAGWDGVFTDMHSDPRSQAFGCIELHVPTMLVEDFGIPMFNDDGKTFGYRMPHWYPFAGRKDYPEKGILIVDDRDKGNQDIQKVLANIQQARHLHGVPLAEGWSVVATGNRVKDRAGATRVLSHLADREIEIEYETNLDDWCKWALQSGVHPVVIAFVRFKPNMLHDFDANRDKNPTPRSWAEGISPLVGKVSPEAEFELYKGRVGEGAAVEFKAFVDMYRKLPNPDAVLMNPDSHSVPTEGSVLYALAGAIAERATDNNFQRVMTYAKRMPPEFTTLVVRDAITRSPELAASSTFTAWATTDGASILF